MATSHPGFKAVQSSIAKREGVGEKAAGAILASATRKASPSAVKSNPRLARVKGSERGEDRKTAAIGRRMNRNRESRGSKREPRDEDNRND